MKRLSLSLSICLLLVVTVTAICYATLTPEVDVQTGMVTNGPIVVNQPFVWVNRVQSTCSVSDAGQQFFSPDPVSVPAASGGNTGTATVTATAVGTFNYVSPCSEVAMPVRVTGGH